jgi:hypothetical protein
VTPPSRRPGRWLAFGALVALGVVAFVWLARRPPEGGSSSGVERLVGRWQRTDGPYIVEVRSGEANGRLDVGYFNPSPINVSRADWRGESGELRVFVELRDVNYPGATYELRYVPERDGLVGRYTQPLVGETFDVQFVRRRE